MVSAGRAADALDLEARTAAQTEKARAAVLLLVENHSVPADRRVWAEATSLRRAGYRVSVVCPRGRFADTTPYEARDGVAIYRFSMPFEERLSLSRRLDPATDLPEPAPRPKLEVGMAVAGKVSNVEPYGVFVRIHEPVSGVDGLLPADETHVERLGDAEDGISKSE